MNAMNRSGFLMILAMLLWLSWQTTFAAVPGWSIVEGESSLSFTGTQNNAPITGKFTKFTGDIAFDPDALKSSHVKVIIDMGSVSFSFKDIETTLKASDWFDVKSFPQAVFEAKDFTKTGDDHYRANGSLTIKNKTLPLAVEFIKKSSSDNKVKVEGTATFKRTAFGVGSGEWASTSEVQDEVKVNFVLTAEKK